jgi:hypothetical protein
LLDRYETEITPRKKSAKEESYRIATLREYLGDTRKPMRELLVCRLALTHLFPFFRLLLSDLLTTQPCDTCQSD